MSEDQRREIEEAKRRMREATRSSVNGSLELARDARRISTTMPRVQPLQKKRGVTGEFIALKLLA